MTDREVLDWWDYISCKRFVFGPAGEVEDIDYLLYRLEQTRALGESPTLG
jgi:hypothetical protein